MISNLFIILYISLCGFIIGLLNKRILYFILLFKILAFPFLQSECSQFMFTEFIQGREILFQHLVLNGKMKVSVGSVIYHSCVAGHEIRTPKHQGLGSEVCGLVPCVLGKDIQMSVR